MLVTVFVLVIACSPTIVKAEDFRQVVFRVHDMFLQVDEVYQTQLLIQANAPHVIEINSSPTDPSITDIILLVDIDSEFDGKVMVHRGGVNHSSRSWQPLSSEYSLEIVNYGYLNLTVSMTIIQTGPPTQQDSLGLWSALPPVILLTVIPPAILALLLTLYGRRRSRESS